MQVDSARLARIYRIARAERGVPPAIRTLTRRDAFMELVASTFRFDGRDRGMLAREFTFWDRVVALVPVRRLTVGDDLLATAANRAIVEDCCR
jgi:hypothetical protein